MKDIFANLYNKVLSFFHQTENKSENAKDVACNRLKLVLMQDRTNLSPAVMDRMRKELIDLLSKYVELDKELLDLNFEQEDSQMALMLSIPVIRAKSEEEILEILAEEDAKKAQEEEEENSEDNEETSEEDEQEQESEQSEETDEEHSESEENSSKEDSKEGSEEKEPEQDEKIEDSESDLETEEEKEEDSTEEKAKKTKVSKK